ncbi:MAG: Phospholipase D/Transphosphatidylase [Candidatus Magasanikbacteria bacterium GW2011_GWA2_56_11]|uniref:Phospholipase D/Transphosphatidylase n=1 Tax=Candidatus Magasanikbacteria bacterium GW2011_GWA2_56_11 TaxID=1619044 RepID=A0A0G2B8H5_9BACT|nr:MAG: Phospholipase D/Transphosphatidylase [Candidatus Magasanikbacteria bacterium GW2011_GWA2_56_11]
MSVSAYKIYATTSEAWEAMYRAIAGAQHSIYWEVYMLLDDLAGKRFFELFEKKAQAGVSVRLIVDYWGSLGLSRRRVEELRSRGVDIRFFQDRKRWSLVWWGMFASRTHRKLLIVDERTGYIGGVNVGHYMRDWLDIQVEVRGQVVRSLLRAFARSYILCGGDKETVKHLLRYSFRVRQRYSDVICDRPDLAVSTVKQKYIEALSKARERVILFSPYYFPDRSFLRALWAAKKRGIRVDLLIPLRSDLRLATYVAYAWFAIMRRYGVHVHMLRKMMHGKGVIMDDDWAMIGSSNIDYPSFHYNHEANLQVRDKRFVRQLQRIVAGWQKDSLTLDEEKWGRRGRWQRCKEWCALRLYRIWFNIK